MASKARAAARTAQAAENQARFLEMVNAKLNMLLKANKLEFDEAAFFGEAPAVEEAAPEGTELSEDNPPENTGGEKPTDGVEATEAPTTGKKK